MSSPTGVRKLDRLLGGGIRDKDRLLLFGPSFQGKEVLARSMYVAALQAGRPAILLLTNRGVDEARRDLIAMDSKFATYEKKGLVWFIDAYSRSIGIEDEAPNVEYIDSAVDLNSISLALNRIHAAIVKDHDDHLLILDSVSTLVLYGNAQAAFRFLQVMVGRSRSAGGTTVLLLDHGMHSDAEVQMFRHLVDGVVQIRSEKDTPQLMVEGLGLPQNPGWIDYKFTDTTFELTGSLAAGRIH